MGKAVSLPERNYPTSINSATWTKLDIHHLDEPSPFPQVLEEEGGESSKGSKNGMLAPSKPAEPVDLYKILKKARSDREKLAYTAQYVVRYPGDFEDLEARLDKYLNLLDYESSRREFLSVCCHGCFFLVAMHHDTALFAVLTLTRFRFLHAPPFFF